MKIIKISFFSKTNQWQGSIELVGKALADKLIVEILSQSSHIAYCSVEELNLNQ